MDALRTVPSDLPEAYKEILQRIENKGIGAKRLAMKILSWIFLAKRPLKMDELREALTVREGDTRLKSMYMIGFERIVEICEGLVTMDECSGITRFTHYTVHEFLLHHRGQVTSLLTSIDLAKICLTYLTFEAFEEVCESKNQIYNRGEIYRMYEYAAMFWSDYARGHAELSSEVRTLIYRLLSSVPKRSSMVLFSQPFHRLRKGQTPLHILAKHGLAKTCEILLKGSLDQSVEEIR